MRTLARFLLGCFAIGALALLGTSLLGPVGTQSLADSTVRRVSSAVPDLNSFSNAAGACVRRNATTAQLQMESMKNSIPRSVAVSDLIPQNSSNWIQGGAQAASQAVGNKPGEFAKKIPIVNRALGSTDAHIASLRQAINNEAANF
jgi:hypothetical protein